MDCRHENLRAVGNQLFCKDCGKELPLEFLVSGTKQAEKPAEEKKPDKAPAKKRTAKKRTAKKAV